MHICISTTQCSQLYPSAVGFNRSIIFLVLKWILPLGLSVLFVYIDTNWLAVLILMGLLHFYYLFQLFTVRAIPGLYQLGSLYALTSVNYL